MLKKIIFIVALFASTQVYCVDLDVELYNRYAATSDQSIIPVTIHFDETTYQDINLATFKQKISAFYQDGIDLRLELVQRPATQNTWDWYKTYDGVRNLIKNETVFEQNKRLIFNNSYIPMIFTALSPELPLACEVHNHELLTFEYKVFQ